MNKSSIIAVLVVFLLSFTVQGKTEIERSMEKVETLERQNQFRIEDLARANEKIKKIETDNQKLEAELNEYKPILDNIKLILSIFGLSVLGGLIYVYWMYVPKKVAELVDAKISSILTDRRDDFIRLLKEYDIEQQVKKNFKIKVLTHPNAQDSYIVNLLSKNEFSVEAFSKVLSLNSVPLSPDDVIVINNEDGLWKNEEIAVFFQDINNYSFYFGKGIISLDSGSQNKFAAANIRTQIVSNLLNLLKYNR